MDPILPASEFAQLRAFLAVADALSFSRAAEVLGMTSSAVSQTLRALEERLGVRLLNRTTRSVSLTDAGAALLTRARPAVLELSEALNEARRQRAAPGGLVRVHAFRNAANDFIAPILAEFGAAYPAITLDITVDDRIVDLVALGFDVGLRLGEVIERDMIAVRLGPDLRQVAVASPGYLARHGRPERPADLLRHRCIRWRWPGDELYRWEFFEAGRWFEVAVEGPLIANSRELALRAALDGAGVAFATETRVARYLADGRLVALLEDWCAPFPGYYLCYPRQRLMAPALRAFIDAVRARARAT